MSLLLDTHVALWAVTNHPRLSDRAKALVVDNTSDIYVSVVSVWEIAIKRRLQRGSANDMPISGEEALNLFEAAGFLTLPVLAKHALLIDHLPLHHADPFDRLMIAQAKAEPMTFLTADSWLLEYGAPVMLM